MNINQLKKLEEKLGEQKLYIQELESRLNLTYAEVVDTKNILYKTHDQIQKLSEELDHLLGFVLMLEEDKLSNKTKGVIALQDYMPSIEIAQNKDSIFGLNIPKKFIKTSSLPTIKYYLYTFDCFICESFELEYLKPSSKKDMDIILQTLIKYIKMIFSQRKIKIKGIFEVISPLDFNSNEILKIKFYGNNSIRTEVENFIDIYTQRQLLPSS